MMLNGNDESRCICQDSSEKQTEPVEYVGGGGMQTCTCRRAHADTHLFKELAHMIVKLVKSYDL